MLGFATGLTVELSTGVPILQQARAYRSFATPPPSSRVHRPLQIGLDTPNPLLFQLLAGAIGGASAFATGRTLVRLQSGDMDVATFRRYASFFGLNAEAVAAAEAKRRKAEGRDFTAADSMAAIEAAKQASLGAEADAAADAAAPRSFEEDASAAVAEGLAVRLDQPDIEKAFAKGVELNNGRAAMLGFAIAILIEAASGVGIVGQMESYAKLVGLLGPQSGF